MMKKLWMILWRVTDMQTTTKSQYELFQEWLDNCPVKYYISDVDSSIIQFEIEEQLQENMWYDESTDCVFAVYVRAPILCECIHLWQH